jgi:hypothetical protein
MALGIAYPFGIRDIKVTPITNSVTEAYGTMLDLPAARTLSFTEAEDFEELRGDDKLLLSRGTGPTVEWELEAGGIELSVYAVIAGGTLTESGVTPNQIKKWSKKTSDARPYFYVEGQAFSDTGGDVHVKLYRCRATGDIEGEFSDGNFYLTACSGTAFPSVKAGNVDVLYDVIYNEAPAGTPIIQPV